MSSNFHDAACRMPPGWPSASSGARRTWPSVSRSKPIPPMLMGGLRWTTAGAFILAVMSCAAEPIPGRAEWPALAVAGRSAHRFRQWRSRVGRADASERPHGGAGGGHPVLDDWCRAVRRRRLHALTLARAVRTRRRVRRNRAAGVAGTRSRRRKRVPGRGRSPRSWPAWDGRSGRAIPAGDSRRRTSWRSRHFRCSLEGW